MHRVPTKNDLSRTRYTWRECAFVFGGVGVAAMASGISVALGAGLEPAGPFWLAALAWTFLANIAHAFWRGIRFGEWPADRAADQDVERRRGDELSYRWRADPTYSCLPGNTFHSSPP